MTSLQRVRSVLDREYRTAKELGGRCGLSAAATAGALGQLRRRGEAEFIIAYSQRAAPAVKGAAPA